MVAQRHIMPRALYSSIKKYGFVIEHSDINQGLVFRHSANNDLQLTYCKDIEFIVVRSFIPYDRQDGSLYSKAKASKYKTFVHFAIKADSQHLPQLISVVLDDLRLF